MYCEGITWQYMGLQVFIKQSLPPLPPQQTLAPRKVLGHTAGVPLWVQQGVWEAADHPPPTPQLPRELRQPAMLAGTLHGHQAPLVVGLPAPVT